MTLNRFFMALAMPLALTLATPVQAADVLAGKPEGQTQSFSYALGVHFAQQFRQRFMQGGGEIDTSALLAAMQDVISGKPLRLSQQELQAALDTANKERAAAQAEAASKNKEAGDAYRAEYAKGEGVQKTASGVLYRVLTAGTGKKPSPRDRVQVHYEGELIDGKVFDSSYKRGEPAVFGVGQVIPGWQEILQLMPEGSTYEVVIPPEHAYGARGAPGNIPPNSTLKFKVELIAIQ